MPYVFDLSIEAPLHIVGDLPKWEEKVPSLSRRADLNGEFMNGRIWLDARTMPERLVIDIRRKSMPDGFKSTSSISIASSRARKLIENFDPGVHQFFPIDVRWRNGDPVGGEWFSFNVYARQDSVVIEDSKLRKSGGAATEHFPPKPIRYYPIYHEKDVTLDERQLGSLNLWRELKVEQSLLCSDALHDAFKAEGLKVFRTFKTKAASG